MNPHDPWLASLDAATWRRANRELVAKILTELVFEEVFDPEPAGPPGAFRLPLPPHGTLTYQARQRLLGHWRVDPDSLAWYPERSAAGDGPETDEPPEVAELVALAAPLLRLDPSTAAGAVTELSNTLLSDVWQLTHGRPADDLAGASLPAVEAELRGHPWIVASKGRIGLDADDLARYSPEARRPFRLLWLAAAPDRAGSRTVPGLSHRSVIRDQVGEEVWDGLQAGAARAGLDPATAVYLPVHPWQWRQKIVPLHTGDLALGRLVPLGTQPARYLPQQSVRTLVDADHPCRRHLKLPLSILNTSVYRGLPPDRTLAAPALTEWFTGMVAGDPFLAESGLVLLGEVASATVTHSALERVPNVPYQHTEMLGAIWRDPVAGHLGPGEQAVPLAATFHCDPWDRPFLAPVIHRSGLDVAAWVRRLHEAVLPPLVHVLYRFGATFSPHGQNCLLILRDGVPARLAVKDFVDDAMISAEPLPELAHLPEPVRECLGRGLEGPLLAQWIQGGLLVCVYRYLSELLEDHFGYPERAFWEAAAHTLRAYQERFEDELGDRFALFDLDAPAFVKLCLNRVRLFERGYADAAERPVAAASGWIDNPLALAATG